MVVNNRMDDSAMQRSNNEQHHNIISMHRSWRDGAIGAEWLSVEAPLDERYSVTSTL